MNFRSFEDYSRFFAFDDSFIHFPHHISGDREGIYENDLSLGKTESGWLLAYETKMSREQDDDFVFEFHIDDIILPEDFFEKYSKKEFKQIVEGISWGEGQFSSKIPSKIHFPQKGITTDWDGHSSRTALKSKEYIVKRESYSVCIPRKLLPFINSICTELDIDFIRSGIYFNYLACWENSIGIICKDEKFFLFKRTDSIEIYGKYNEEELKQALAGILNLQNVKISKKILNKKRTFKDETEARNFMKVSRYI